MAHRILGLHHVTATVGAARPDLEFYTGLLGLRLVKKTVNFDNHFVYHFYYGTERGAPSTIMTTFPYAGWGVAVGRKGAGQITVTSFSVPADSLEFWRKRFAAGGITPLGGTPRDDALRVADPSGLVIELRAAEGDERAPWLSHGIGEDAAIRGLHSVTLSLRSLERTLELLTGVLGFHVAADEGGRIRVAAGSETPGQVLELIPAAGAPAAMTGRGTVHPGALPSATPAEQLALREELVGLGLGVTEVRDRQYFQSIYFREPGGVLFEVATVQPGFTVDEPLDRLGQELKLPPWEEPNRADIEARLTPLGAP
jgi:glyoxalase family protein